MADETRRRKRKERIKKAMNICCLVQKARGRSEVYILAGYTQEYRVTGQHFPKRHWYQIRMK